MASPTLQSYLQVGQQAITEACLHGLNARLCDDADSLSRCVRA
ncbi:MULTISPECIES: hypothetical protein [Streptomyces]|nr:MULTISPECIES: hypothetical protein [Streptomyces]WCL88523.1 hypothetical protein PPN52_30140 [Streptomyces sp. JCM 35825]